MSIPQIEFASPGRCIPQIDFGCARLFGLSSLRQTSKMLETDLLCRQKKPGTFKKSKVPGSKCRMLEGFYRPGEKAGLIVNVMLRPGSSVRRSAAPGE
jgi:hypothetical protein